MIDGKIVFLCPESVPIDNKGEEAIIKGIIDTLGISMEKCEYHVLDPSVRTMTQRRSLFLHPLTLFYPKWRMTEFGFGFSIDRIYASICSAIRHFLFKFYPQWVKIRPKSINKLVNYILDYKSGRENKIPKRYRESIRHLSNVDYVIAGHDGGLSIEVCHLLLAYKDQLKINYCIFGSCLKPRVQEKHQLEVYGEAFSCSDIIIARNPIGYRWAQKYFPNINVRLAPDPAFGMNSISIEQARDLVNHLGLSNFFAKEVVMITNAEPAPISRKSFDKEATREQKIKAHREFFSKLLKELLKKYDFNFLFLPHTIGPTTDMDDRKISRDIIQLANLNDSDSKRCIVLDNDLSAAELKGIISLGKFLIAERVHSVIGAIGVHTPFLCLASKYDNRVEGMLKEMAGLQDYIYYLNDPDVDSCMMKIDDIVNNLDNKKAQVSNLDMKFKSILREEGKIVNDIIQESVKGSSKN